MLLQDTSTNCFRQNFHCQSDIWFSAVGIMGSFSGYGTDDGAAYFEVGSMLLGIGFQSFVTGKYQDSGPSRFFIFWAKLVWKRNCMLIC